MDKTDQELVIKIWSIEKKFPYSNLEFKLVQEITSLDEDVIICFE